MHESTGAGNTVEPRQQQTNGNEIPKLVIKLLERLACELCTDPIRDLESIFIWPRGKFVAHFKCFAQDRGFVRREGRA